MDTSILKSKLQQKISHKIVNNLIIEAGLPLVVGGPAIQAAGGWTIAAGANAALDTMDSDTWKTGGSRTKTQLELTGLGPNPVTGRVGSKGTFVQAWKDVAGGLAPSTVAAALNPKWVEKQVQSEEEAHKEQVHKLNPDLKARQEWERQQRAANREQDEQEQKEREAKREQDLWRNPRVWPKA